MVEDETRTRLAQVPRRHRDPSHHLTSSVDSVTLVPGVKFRTYIKPEDGVTALSELDRTPTPQDAAWWRQAVVYQIYPRSFADSNGDGIGDLPRDHRQGGLPGPARCRRRVAEPVLPVRAGRRRLRRRRLPRRRPADRDARATSTSSAPPSTRAGIRLIVDIVPNHTSNRHVWFQEALASAPGSPARERYIFRPRPRRARRAAAERLDLDLRRPRLGAASATASGTCTCSPRSSRTSTGPTTRCARSSSRR